MYARRADAVHVGEARRRLEEERAHVELEPDVGEPGGGAPLAFTVSELVLVPSTVLLSALTDMPWTPTPIPVVRELSRSSMRAAPRESA